MPAFPTCLLHGYKGSSQKQRLDGSQWLAPVILATEEAKIRRIRVQSQPEQIVFETLPQKNPQQNRAGEVALSPNPSTTKKRKKKFKKNCLLRLALNHDLPDLSLPSS
jgi:hypothetical protein